MDHKQVSNYLENRQMFGIKLGLKGISDLLKKIGSPQKNQKIIHVAGTNGKGSVCAMLSSILQQAGYNVGMYTSPHLIKINERYKINGKDISDQDFVKYFQKVLPHITTQTYFEITTAMAFLYFMEKKVDFLVLEVGMGGRLDATNVAKPLVSIITNISLEHTKYLGNTGKKIAYEKAGIIKKNVPTVTGAKGAALSVIKKICKKRNSQLFIVKKVNKIIVSSLNGEFQYQNAALVLKTIEILNKHCKILINKDSINKGLRKTIWPGRLQFVKKNILIDCAHNPDGARAISREIKKIKKNYKKIIMVIGILNDKDIKSILNLLVPLADNIIITRPREARAEKPEVLADYIKKFNKPYTIINDAKQAFKYGRSIIKNHELLLVTGSCYLVGEFLEYYQ